MIDLKKLKFIVLAVLAVISLTLFVVPTIFGLDVEVFRGVLETYGVPQLIYVAWIILATVTTLPVSAAMIAGIIYFSFVDAMILTCVGMLIGAIGTFYVSRWLGKDFVKVDYKIKGRTKLHIFNELVHKHSLAYVVLLAFIYAFPSNLAYMIAGVTEVTLFQLVCIVALGNLGTAFGVGGIILGVLQSNISYIIAGALLLAAINILPLFRYYKEMKKLVLLVFSRKAYERFEKLEKAEKKLIKFERKIGKGIKKEIKEVEKDVEKEIE
jgi:uncharacterized membrane protein YdjX (TVP38/TMEM64 family)